MLLGTLKNEPAFQYIADKLEGALKGVSPEEERGEGGSFVAVLRKPGAACNY